METVQVVRNQTLADGSHSRRDGLGHRLQGASTVRGKGFFFVALRESSFARR